MIPAPVAAPVSTAAVLSAPAVSSVPNPLAILMGFLQNGIPDEHGSAGTVSGKPDFTAYLADLDQHLRAAGLSPDDLTDPAHAAQIMIPPAIIQHLQQISVGADGAIVLSVTPPPLPSQPLSPVAPVMTNPAAQPDGAVDSLQLTDGSGDDPATMIVAPDTINADQDLFNHLLAAQPLQTDKRAIAALTAHLQPVSATQTDDADRAMLAAALNAMDVGGDTDNTPMISRAAPVDADAMEQQPRIQSNPAAMPVIVVPTAPTAMTGAQTVRLAKPMPPRDADTLTVIRDGDSVLRLTADGAESGADATPPVRMTVNDAGAASLTSGTAQGSDSVAHGAWGLIGWESMMGDGFFAMNGDGIMLGSDTGSVPALGPLNTGVAGTAAAATALVGTGAAHPASVNVAVQLHRAAATRESQELTISLNPPELGRVHARLSYNGRDNSVSAHIFVENKDAFMILQRDAHALHNALTGAGVEVGSGGLSFELASQNQNFDGFMAGNDNKSDSPARSQGDAQTGQMAAETTGADNSPWSIDPITGRQRYNIVV